MIRWHFKTTGEGIGRSLRGKFLIVPTLPVKYTFWPNFNSSHFGDQPVEWGGKFWVSAWAWEAGIAFPPAYEQTKHHADSQVPQPLPPGHTWVRGYTLSVLSPHGSFLHYSLVHLGMSLNVLLYETFY